jgi:hypothetical protein
VHASADFLNDLILINHLTTSDVVIVDEGLAGSVREWGRAC